MSWRNHLREGISELSALRPFDYASAPPELARLDCNESAFGPTSRELEDFAQAIRQLSLQRYPEMTGQPLREALARLWQIAPEEILLGNGSVEILGLLMTAFGNVRGGPARVLYPEPSFPYYAVLAQTHGFAPVSVALDQRFQLDESSLVEAMDRTRPALALFASPNNPTGNRFDRGVLERLARRTDAAFVVDEAYADFTNETMMSLINEIEGFFVLRTLSKIGLAGLRVGALVGARDAIAELDKVRLPWNINSVTSALSCVALRDPNLLQGRVRWIVQLRRELEHALRQIPELLVYPSDANFLLVRVPRNAGLVVRRLLNEGVLVKNVSQPGLLEDCLRITVGTSVENARCVRALSSALESLR